uniref:Uncharacterized protein n=1 Tax=Megaselia scalaris TaxID=36166 RepID=T1GID8_MEGSC
MQLPKPAKNSSTRVLAPPKNGIVPQRMCWLATSATILQQRYLTGSNFSVAYPQKLIHSLQENGEKTK